MKTHYENVKVSNETDGQPENTTQTISSVESIESPSNPLNINPAFIEKSLEEHLADEGGGVNKLFELILKQRALQNELAI